MAINQQLYLTFINIFPSTKMWNERSIQAKMTLTNACPNVHVYLFVEVCSVDIIYFLKMLKSCKHSDCATLQRPECWFIIEINLHHIYIIHNHTSSHILICTWLIFKPQCVYVVKLNNILCDMCKSTVCHTEWHIRCPSLVVA